MLKRILWSVLGGVTTFLLVPTSSIAQQYPLFINVFPDDGSIYVTWNHVDNVDTYQLIWSSTSDNVAHNVHLAGNQLHYTVVDLLNEQAYRFQVIALQNSTSIAESQTVIQKPHSRENDKVIHTSWQRLNEHFNAHSDLAPDLNHLSCRNQIIPWNIQSPDCIFEVNGFFLFLARGAGSIFDPPQDSRSVEAIRKIAIRSIWQTTNPFDNPAAFPITITEVVTPQIGLVKNFASARGYTIRYHPQLASRITWFIPQILVPGRYAIYAEGHCDNCISAMHEPNGAETIDWLLARGWQVVGLDMPLWGQNSVDRLPKGQLQSGYNFFDDSRRSNRNSTPYWYELSNIPSINNQLIVQDHNHLIYLLNDGANNSILQFFFLPVKAVIDRFVASYAPNDPTILIIGRSGGGWTSYFYSPLDPRIDYAVSVAGGLPLSLRANHELGRDMGDHEQLTADIGVITHEDLMKSAGSQGALYIYNQHDSCCHTVDPSDPNYAAFITYLEAQAQPLGKQLEVYVDPENQMHSLGARGYEKLSEFLELDTPPIGSTIKGLSSVALGESAVFTASVAPLSASQPVTYVWQADEQDVITHSGGLSDTTSFVWTTLGQKVLQVTATNALGSVSTNYTITVGVPLTDIVVESFAVVALGESAVFTASVAPLSASQPVTYVWQADEQDVIIHNGGLSDTTSFVWTTPGQKVLQVTTTNALGSVSTNYTITVGVPLTDIVVESFAVVALGESAVFTASVAPLSASQPVTYLWQADEQDVIIHNGGLSDTTSFVWTTPGQKVLQVTTTNALGSVSTNYTITVGVPLTDIVVESFAVVALGESAVFTASVAPLSASQPVTYLWQADEQDVIIHNGGLSDTTSFVWTTPGQKVLQATANNTLGPVSALYTIEVGIPITGVRLIELAPLQVNVPYSFTAVVEPLEASLPVTYLWENDVLSISENNAIFVETFERMNSIVLGWSDPGQKTIRITASNALGSATITSTVEVSSMLFLPIIYSLIDSKQETE